MHILRIAAAHYNTLTSDLIVVKMYKKIKDYIS